MAAPMPRPPPVTKAVFNVTCIFFHVKIFRSDAYGIAHMWHQAHDLLWIYKDPGFRNREKNDTLTFFLLFFQFPKDITISALIMVSRCYSWCLCISESASQKATTFKTHNFKHNRCSNACWCYYWWYVFYADFCNYFYLDSCWNHHWLSLCTFRRFHRILTRLSLSWLHQAW